MKNLKRDDILENLQMADFDKYKKTVESNLFRQLTYIRQLEEPRIVTIDPLEIGSPLFERSPREIRSQLGLPPDGNQVIYIFRISSQFSDEAEFNKFVAQRCETIEKNRNEFTRVTGATAKNILAQKKRLSDMILYVGTSGSFAARLKTHIGFGSKDTATLLLNKWEDLVEKKYLVTLNILDFGTSIEAESLKLLEFEISSELTPLIGRNRKS